MTEQSSAREGTVKLTKVLRILGGVGILLLLVTGFTPLPNVLSYWLAPARPLERAGAIVVLGAGGLRGGAVLTETSLRGVIDGIDLYRRGLAPVLVLSGTKSKAPRGEAEVRADFARDCGVPPAAMLTVSSGRTTREEALEIQTLLQARGVRKIVLVTDSDGMARAMGAFEKVGFDVIPSYGVPVLNWGGSPEARLGLMRLVVMEIVARLYYHVARYL